jgi:hypothetical protein
VLSVCVVVEATLSQQPNGLAHRSLRLCAVGPAAFCPYQVAEQHAHAPGEGHAPPAVSLAECTAGLGGVGCTVHATALHTVTARAGVSWGWVWRMASAQPPPPQEVTLAAAAAAAALGSLMQSKQHWVSHRSPTRRPQGMQGGHLASDVSISG